MAGLAAALAGCMTSVRSTWDQSPDGTIHAAVSVRSTGTQSEALAKGFDAGPAGSILEDASGKQDSTAAVAAIRDVFVAFAPIMNTLAAGAAVQASPAGAGAETPAAAEEGAAQSVSEILRGTPGGETAYSAEKFTGSPGPAGEGVYGRASCARCQAYAAAHPEAQLIDLDSGANRADMWAALRLRGYAGQSVSLPVNITADGYTQAAR